MNKPNNISIDQSFQNAFETYDPGFQSSDWDDMLSRLESDETPVILLPPKHIFTNTKHTIIMILITTLTAGMLWMTSPQEEVLSANTTVVPHSTQSVVERATEKIEIKKNQVNSNAEQVNQKTTNQFVKQAEINLNDYVASLREPMVSETNGILTEAEANPNLDFSPLLSTPTITSEEVLASPDTAKFFKTVVSRTWADTTYKYEYYRPSRDIEEAWIGLYYTNQQMENSYDWQQIGRHAETHGFNVQFMFGNVLPGENLAVFAGVDWGMQFYGRSDNSEVLINSVNEDRGLTFLRSHSNDVFVSGQIEWAEFRVVPYLTGSIGTRILTTGQTTRALLASTEYESTQDNAVQTRATLGLKAGAGVRFKLSPHVYFDSRYEIIQTGNLNTVDYNNTAFNGLDYDLGLKKIDLNAGQFRFGFVFDVSSEESNKVVDVPGHWEETTQQLYADPADSTKVFVPCPCDKPKTKKRSNRTSTPRNEPTDEQKRSPWNQGGIFSPGSGSGGSGKGDFPGVKKPPVRW